MTGTSAGFSAALAQIRRVVLARDQKLEPSMRGLRMAIRLAFAMMIIMGVVGYAVLSTSLTEMNDSINDLSAGTDLRDAMAGIFRSVLNLNLMSKGLLSAATESVERTNMYQYSMQLSALQSRLFLQKKKMSPKLRSIFADPVVPMEQMVDEKVRVSVGNLWFAFEQISAHADVVRQLPLSEIGDDTNPHVFVRLFLLHESKRSILLTESSDALLLSSISGRIPRKDQDRGQPYFA